MSKDKIVCLGDSITYGYPYSPEYSWVTYVEKHSDLELLNAGVNGNIMEEMAGRYASNVRRYHPSAVIILGGTNDAFCGEVSRSETLYYLEQIVKGARQDRIKPVIALPVPIADDPPAAAKLAALNEAYTGLAESHHLLVLDFAAAFTDSEGQTREELLLDGVHPNMEGYLVMGETALAFCQTYFD
jgi:acyl-CoA thioesterase-1